MQEVGFDVDGDAMQRHPLLHADAERGDLVLVAFAFVRALHPDTDAILAPLAAHVESGQGADDPSFQSGDEAAQVRPAPPEINHHIADALAGAMIGHLAAAAALVNREAGVQDVGEVGAGAGGIKRRVLDQPDQLRRLAIGDRFDARLHDRQRIRIGDGRIADAPFHRRHTGGCRHPQIQFVAHINPALTIPCCHGVCPQ